MADFYYDMDIQVGYRPKSKFRGMAPYQNPNKLGNSSSFGIPMVAYPEPSYVREFGDSFVHAHSIEEILAQIKRLKDDPLYYKYMAQKALAIAEDYHIDNVSKRYLDLEKNLQNTLDKLDNKKTNWDEGKHKTLYFYTKKLPWKAKQFNQPLQLPDYFAPMIGDKKEVTIAELGAGMFCTIGSLWKTAKVNIYPSDALADDFNQILNDAGIKPLIPVEKQDMENLTYPNEFFDIVHSVNALDHTINPIKAISEMYRVCKPGGYIYLRHFVNVGEKERYVGLHMWNIDLDENGEGIIWNPNTKFILSQQFPGFKSVKKREADYEKEKTVVSILHKNE